MRREILDTARATGFEGSILDLYQMANQGANVSEMLQAEAQAKQQNMLVAQTPQEQQVGLREQHAMGNTGASMAFPDVAPNTSFNTQGMKAPINITKVDDQGHLVKSYQNVPPGIKDLPTGPKRGTVIETPAYQGGGYKQKYQTGGPREKSRIADNRQRILLDTFRPPGDVRSGVRDAVGKFNKKKVQYRFKELYPDRAKTPEPYNNQELAIQNIRQALGNIDDELFNEILEEGKNIKGSFKGVTGVTDGLKAIYNLDLSNAKELLKEANIDKNIILDGTNMNYLVKKYLKSKLKKGGYKNEFVPDPNNKEYIKNWIESRNATGRFENQLGNEQMEKGLENLDNVERVTRKEMVKRGYPDATYYQLGSSPAGMYGPKDNIYFAEPTFFQKMLGKTDSSTDVHELAHVFDIGTSGLPGKDMKAIPETNIHKAIKNIPVKGGYETEDYLPPAEIYAELMRFRKNNNIDPNKIFTEDDLPELRKKLKKESNYGLFNLDGIYEDEEILRLMNEVVSIDAPQENNIEYAKYGGYRSKHGKDPVTGTGKTQVSSIFTRAKEAVRRGRKKT